MNSANTRVNQCSTVHSVHCSCLPADLFTRLIIIRRVDQRSQTKKKKKDRSSCKESIVRCFIWSCTTDWRYVFLLFSPDERTNNMADRQSLSPDLKRFIELGKVRSAVELSSRLLLYMVRLRWLRSECRNKLCIAVECDLGPDIDIATVTEYEEQ